jgi:hypothetical protein
MYVHFFELVPYNRVYHRLRYVINSAHIILVIFPSVEVCQKFANDLPNILHLADSRCVQFLTTDPDLEVAPGANIFEREVSHRCIGAPCVALGGCFSFAGMASYARHSKCCC